MPKGKLKYVRCTHTEKTDNGFMNGGSRNPADLVGEYLPIGGLLF